MLTDLVLFLCLQENPAAPPVQAPPPAESAPILDPIHGVLRVRYRYRTTSGDSDSDLYEFLTVGYGDARKDLISAGLSVRLAEDTDGNRNVQGSYPYSSLDDRSGSFATQRLYTAYLDVRPDAGRAVLFRGGRQILEEFPEAVSMDGALVRVPVGGGIALTTFGGIPVNPFEASPQGDSMYGASAEWSPVAEGRGRYRVEYLHLRDENIFGLHKDDLVGVSLDEGSGPWSLHARYTFLERDSRDLVARLVHSIPDAGFQAQVQGTYVFHQIQALSYPLDPYAGFMMDLQPYLDLSFRTSQSFGSIFSIDAMFTSRQLVRDGVESPYNHEFKQVQIAPSVRNWPVEGMCARVVWDRWDSTSNRYWTLGGDLSVPLHRDVQLSVGTSTALYSIDGLTGQEHERVRMTTVALRWQTDRMSSIDARFTLEEDVFGTFRIVEVGFRHGF